MSAALNQSSWGYPDERPDNSWRGPDRGGRGNLKRGSVDPSDLLFKRRHESDDFL